jgi:hypothetical protein
VRKIEWPVAQYKVANHFFIVIYRAWWKRGGKWWYWKVAGPAGWWGEEGYALDRQHAIEAATRAALQAKSVWDKTASRSRPTSLGEPRRSLPPGSALGMVFPSGEDQILTRQESTKPTADPPSRGARLKVGFAVEVSTERADECDMELNNLGDPTSAIGLLIMVIVVSVLVSRRFRTKL